MRIAVVTRHRDHVGGVETYVERLLAALGSRGHRLLLWHEYDGGTTPIEIPEAADTCSVAAIGSHAALAALAEWRPDVIFAHGLADPALERRVQQLAPAVLMLHTYHGTCVAGSKTHGFPRPRPCTRTLGAACLVRYFPLRCGGLSPVTMVRRYRAESAHRGNLEAFAAVTVLSAHMGREAAAHGVDAARVTVLPPPIEGPRDPELPPVRRERLAAVMSERTSLRLLFLGRLEPAKGGHVLIDAAALLARRLGRPIDLAIVGDGRCRLDWTARAETAQAAAPGLTVRFPGWVNGSERLYWFDWADLLAVPSLWPEPFGLSGAEAAAAGLPAVAFDVGGTREWLDADRSGRLAAAGRFDTSALADAVAWTLESPGRLAALAAGARARAATWSMARHAEALEAVLFEATGASCAR